MLGDDTGVADGVIDGITTTLGVQVAVGAGGFVGVFVGGTSAVLVAEGGRGVLVAVLPTTGVEVTVIGA